jgi:hypothetical protein
MTDEPVSKMPEPKYARVDVDVKALAERLRDGRARPATALELEAADALLSAQEEAAKARSQFVAVPAECHANCDDPQCPYTHQALTWRDVAERAQEEAAGLRVERDEWRANATEFKDLCARWEARSDAFEAKLADAVGLLEPFAKYLDTAAFDLDNHGAPLPDDQGMGWVYLTIGEFRRARTFLASIKETGDAR